MPEYPHNAKFLSAIQRDLAVWRIESESGAAEGTVEASTWQPFLAALKDPKIYLLIFMNMMSQCQGSIANFFPSIVSSLGYDRVRSLLLTAPPYVLAGFVYYLISWYSDVRIKLTGCTNPGVRRADFMLNRSCSARTLCIRSSSFLSPSPAQCI